ncbi:hypothetical protein [Rickettsiales endosymbiont of Trichoplax sp. H2]|uniref:hypothetical protein n=1 Tax=Rickettsiales endosymbiont of Trichoplax sp. H2 TaxID=2021221 RepID=UPI0012B3BDDA|nr:hypothetical protein [Rickettsiales endosymbiont of Trichoplax sp. H2]MSO14087.1 hypothetical protein [Rickettsiales endosymbiont of Trichoplax sp. H2]
MADATADQIKFAQSRMNYFEKELNKGANDKLKALVKVTKKTTASDIATAIKDAENITPKDVTDAKAAAANAETKLTTDVGDVATKLAAAQQKVTDLITKIDKANTAAEKIVKDTEKTAVTDPLGKANTAASEAKTKLDGIDINDIKTKTGADLETAINDAVQAIEDAVAAIGTAKTEVGNANTAAGAITEGTDTDQTPTPDKTAVTGAITAANTEVGSAETSVGDVKTAGTTAQKDYTDYADKKNTADTIKEGTSPIIKATNDACPNIKDTKAVKGDDVTTCFADGFKDYGFINAILKNIPNAGTGALKATGDAFNAYGDDLTGPSNKDKLDSANFYYKLVGTVCGFAPFDGEQSKLPAGTTKCYEQANKVAVAILSSPNCGSDKLDSGAVKGACYTELAIGNLYNNGDTDAMFIDISHAYPDDVVTV